MGVDECLRIRIQENVLCKEDIGFKSASIYKYKVGMDKAQLILDVDMSEITDTISYEEDNPLMNSTYILYYEVAR